MAKKPEKTDKIFRSYLNNISLALPTPFGDVVLPAKHTAPKNIAFIGADAYAFLTGEGEPGDKVGGSRAQFQELLADETIKELDKVPDSYFEAAERLAEADTKIEEANKATEDEKAKTAALAAENEALKKKLIDAGIKLE